MLAVPADFSFPAGCASPGKDSFTIQPLLNTGYQVETVMDWLTGTTAGKMLYAFLISMVPVIELRVGMPLASAKGLPPLYLALPLNVKQIFTL